MGGVDTGDQAESYNRIDIRSRRPARTTQLGLLLTAANNTRVVCNKLGVRHHEDFQAKGIRVPPTTAIELHRIGEAIMEAARVRSTLESKNLVASPSYKLTCESLVNLVTQRQRLMEHMASASPSMLRNDGSIAPVALGLSSFLEQLSMALTRDWLQDNKLKAEGKKRLHRTPLGALDEAVQPGVKERRISGCFSKTLTVVAKTTSCHSKHKPDTVSNLDPMGKHSSRKRCRYHQSQNSASNTKTAIYCVGCSEQAGERVFLCPGECWQLWHA
jgi:hypothetical protein